ncbi:LOW QUALITY PROTEIN: uncharacterized protein LOC124083035 [Marmota monax]|nr:LOW QUALITY PROTEIN: uncharacterized protein LOC124083035 [Marmota monax]
MLLPLLGACAVVGPFQGPEWEPVRGLISQDCSCRDPWCCGNLLVLCLFLIWQVRHYWHHFTRNRLLRRSIIKVPSQKWAMPSMRCEIFFRLAPEFVSPGDFRGRDAHVQQWVQKQRWRYRKSLLESWTQNMFSSQNLLQDSSWGAHTLHEPIFCISSFSSTCPLSQDSSWETWQVSWCLKGSQTHSALDTCQRIGRLLVHSQEKLVPLEHVLSRKICSPPMTFVISLPKLPSAQRLQFCSGQFLPDPAHQQMVISTWKFWNNPQDTWAPLSETQTIGREYSRETQAPGWANQRESRGVYAWEIKASGGQLSIDFGTEHCAEAKDLECRNQSLVINETDGEILIPGQKNRMEIENQAQIEEVGKKIQREAGGKNPPETQIHMGENQEQLRCKVDAKTQTPRWGYQEKSGGGGTLEIQTFERKNKKEPRKEEEGEIQAHGLGKQGQTGGENAAEAQIPECRKQNQTGGDPSAETEAEEGRNKDQVGNEDAVQTPTSGRENLEDVKQENRTGGQALGWGKQECSRSDNITEIQALMGEKQGQGGGENARETQASRGEKQKLSRHAVQVRRKKLKEIRKEDWVVIQTRWWGNQSPVMNEIDRQFKILWKRNPRGFKDKNGTMNQELGGENQGQLENEFHGNICIPQWKNQEHIRGKDGANTQILEARNWGELTSKSDGETHSAEWKKVEHTEGESSAEILLQGMRNLREAEEEDGIETWEGGERSQSHSGSDIDRMIHSSQWKNQKQMEGKDGTEILSPKKRKQRQPEGEDDIKTQKPENQGQLENVIGRSHSPRMGSWGQTEGENIAENQASEEKNQREAGIENGRKVHIPREKNQSLLRIFLLATGEGEHLISQGIAPAREYKARVRPTSQQAQTGSRRKPQKHKGVDPGKIHRVTQPQNPQSLAAPFGKPSACPSLLCGQALQATTTLVGVPTTLTIPPKWPVLKKSKRLLLESLMRRRIAHLKWGLPRRILESYLLFSFFGSCSLPWAGVKLPELGKGQELQRQQEKHCEAQGSMPGFKSPERFQRVLPSDGKRSKLPTQARALERCRPHRSEPTGTSIPPEKPRRNRPPGGAREPQIQEEASKAKLPVPKNPRPWAESVNWCSPERVPEPSSENSKGRKVIIPDVSQKAERAPREVRTSSSRASHDPWKKEHILWEASQFPRHKYQQPTHWRRKSLEPAEDRGARQLPPSVSTDSSSIKGSLYSKTAKLSMTLLRKMSWSPQLAKPRNSVPRLSRVGNPHAREDSIRVHTASERDHQPPGHCSAGVSLPRTKTPQGQRPHGAPKNSSAPKKFGFMKRLRCFLFQCGLKK